MTFRERLMAAISNPTGWTATTESIVRTAIKLHEVENARLREALQKCAQRFRGDEARSNDIAVMAEGASRTYHLADAKTSAEWAEMCEAALSGEGK